MVTSLLNGTAPALTLLSELWAERPLSTAKMQPSGPKYITLKDAGGQDIAISDTMIAEHLQGTATYACSLIGADGLARALMTELDSGADAEAYRVLATYTAAGLTACSIVCPGSDGHDGSHTWALYAEWWNPERLQEQSRQILRACQLEEKEIYPSNAKIRLPFGLHVRTKRRGVLLLQDGQRYDLDTYDGLSAGISAVCALPLNTTPPPPTPARAQAFVGGNKTRAAGDTPPARRLRCTV